MLFLFFSGNTQFLLYAKVSFRIWRYNKDIDSGLGVSGLGKVQAGLLVCVNAPWHRKIPMKPGHVSGLKLELFKIIALFSWQEAADNHTHDLSQEISFGLINI